MSIFFTKSTLSHTKWVKGHEVGINVLEPTKLALYSRHNTPTLEGKDLHFKRQRWLIFGQSRKHGFKAWFWHQSEKYQAKEKYLKRNPTEYLTPQSQQSWLQWGIGFSNEITLILSFELMEMFHLKWQKKRFFWKIKSLFHRRKEKKRNLTCLMYKFKWLTLCYVPCSIYSLLG